VRPWLVRAAVAALAVALGIGVGAGPLQRSDSERDKQLAAQKAEAAHQQQKIDSLESAAAFGEAFARAVTPSLTRNALAGRSVALVTLPGADPAVVEKVRAGIAAASGRITGRVDLAAAMARSSSRQLVDALTSQMVTQTPGLAVPAGAAGYERFGLLLARALGTGRTGQPAHAAYDPTAVGIVSGLTSAELVKVSQPISARAGLAVVVAGPPARTAAAAADNTVPVTILRSFAAALPTVVVGSTAAAGARGVVGALRADRAARAAVTAVDSAETTLGQIVGVLALAARARGTIGQFGAVHAADGAVPGASP
jgi:hypothetical protein